MIKYYDHVAVKKEEELKKISFEDVANYLFDKQGFFEFLEKEDYLHLYFDFDEIKTEKEYLDVKVWLDSLVEIFGKYTYGGYAQDQSFAEKYGFRPYPIGNHWLSIHVIYYETCIRSIDLMDIMNYSNGKFSTKQVHKLCDPNAYKLASRQSLRHIMSNKIMYPNCPENKNNHGYLVVENAKNTIQKKQEIRKQIPNHIVQIRGNEFCDVIF